MNSKLLQKTFSISLALLLALALLPARVRAAAPAAPIMPPALYSAFLDASSKNAPAAQTTNSGMAWQTPGLKTAWSPAGLSVAPQSGKAWKWNLQMDGFGRQDKVFGLPAPKFSQADGRTEFSYAAFSEWYRATDIGLEQGFSIHQKPAGNGQLVLHMQLDTVLSGALSADSRSVSFAVGNGQALHYSDLRALDAKGHDLPAGLIYSKSQIAIQIDDHAAAYPITVDPLIYVENELVALDGGKNDMFGISVAISGDTALVGAWDHHVGSNTDQGAAYIFQSQGNTWVPQAELTASNGAAYDCFGVSVAITGDTAIIGAHGHNNSLGEAFVFVKPASGWVSSHQTATLTASDGAFGDIFGASVAISGNTAVIGAPHHNSSQGEAYVFMEPTGGWATGTQTARLNASDGAASDGFGSSVAISGDTVLIGAPEHNGEVGEAYVFLKPASGWANGTQTAILTASDGVSGGFFGESVAISGKTVLIGAPDNNGDVGEAYVFLKPASGWANGTQTARLNASDGAANDSFGISVAISGDSAVIGAPAHSSGLGEAYVFVKPAGGWTNGTETARLNASDGSVNDNFGTSVAISGDSAIVASYWHNSSKGAAYVYFPYHSEDLGVNAYSSSLSPYVGQTVTFTVSVENYGSNTSPDVMLSALLPAGFSLTKSAASLGYYDPITGEWIIDSLGANVIASLYLQAKVTASAAGTRPVFTAALLGGDANSTNNIATVTMNLVPSLKFSPTSLTFASQLIQTASPAQTVTLTNVSAGNLSLGTLAAPAGFVLSSNPCNGKVLAASGTCTFAVQFKPAAASSYSANLTIPVTSPAASYQLPIGGKGLAGTQLLTNPSFETDANHDKVPDGWAKTGTWVAADGQDCSVHHTGACSLKFSGTNVLKSLTFTKTKSGVAGDDYLFTVWRHAASVPAGSTLDAHIQIYNGTTLVATKTVSLPVGTYGFTQSSLPFTMTTAYTKLVVTLEFKGASGTLWFDDASLVWAP